MSHSTPSASSKTLPKLAQILLESAVTNTHINDLAEKLEVSQIAIYKWLNGSAISPVYAYWLISRLRHRVESISNKRRREQATAMLKDLDANQVQA